MRTKVISLTIKYIARAFGFIFLTTGIFYLAFYLLNWFLNDPGLASIFFFAILFLFGICYSCYDMAKQKIDMENRDLLRQLDGK